jgi:hypothetical protein
LIVLAGRVAAASDVLPATIRQTVYAQSLPFATRRLEITGAELGADGGVIGVATMVVDRLLSPGRLSAWIPAGSPAGRRRSPPGRSEPAAFQGPPFDGRARKRCRPSAHAPTLSQYFCTSDAEARLGTGGRARVAGARAAAALIAAAAVLAGCAGDKAPTAATAQSNPALVREADTALKHLAHETLSRGPNGEKATQAPRRPPRPA